MYEEMRVDVENIIDGKETISTKEIGMELGIHHTKFGWHFRRFLVSVLRENGWRFKSYRTPDGRVSKTWVNEKYMGSREYLTSPGGSVGATGGVGTGSSENKNKKKVEEVSIEK